MYSLRSAAPRVARASLCTQYLHRNASLPSRAFSALPKRTLRQQVQSTLHPPSRLLFTRLYSSKSSADSLIEEIQDQYATARDEFEIAAEESEKKTVYAADDRAAARDELDKLKSMYEEALSGPDGEEIKGRVGQRIRELDNAVEAMEKSATED
ncbi:hypothetical protein EG329_010528 [Mollisiaceae sp. DMI_Dod_QoI]|nr:hypothetical protein EG329_010528 [Helotiales sp. DMI_Dod_QoI]